MKILLPITISVLTYPAFAEGMRKLDSHEHGVGKLNIAIEGSQIAMELVAPGADIVGFEHSAETAEDRAAIKAALTILETPLELFGMSTDADCRVEGAHADLDGDEDHEGHDHDTAHDHASGHDDHEDEAGHTEFHAEYSMTCDTPSALTDIAFDYFDVFENAREVEVQIVTPTGATAVEVTRDAPTLDMRDLF